MPVLPLVGSTMTVSLVILPLRSAASIIDTPMRSLTDQSGLKFSSLATMVPGRPGSHAPQLDQRRVPRCTG